MLPPVDPAVLTANPKFAVLHQSLVTSKLNHNGSSNVEDVAVVKARQEFKKLQDVVHVVLAQLSGRLEREDQKLLQDDIAIQYQQALTQLYTPDVQLALKNQERHLKQEIRGLRERLEEAETQLLDYERVKGMRVIAAAYGEVKRECETVQEEIRRLEDSR
ncbi:hypothetical protein LTR28_013199 [Elasticomyces elasticus]|nr:hypothetical protein LTR28_013199 [Elasticomyces elasticus]